MWRKRASRGPDEATFTSYGRLEAIVLLALALTMCVGAGALLGDGWPNRSASVGAWLGRCVLQATLVLMCVAAALFYANLARPRLSYWRQAATTDSSALTFTQDGLHKVVPWEQVEEYRRGFYQDALVGAGERIAITGSKSNLCAIVRRHLPRGAKPVYLPRWRELLGIEPPASAKHSIIWPNQAIFKHSSAVIAWYLGLSLALLGDAGIWVHRIASWAGIDPQFIGEVKPAIVVPAVLICFYAVLALVLARSGVSLLRHRGEAIETNDQGISMIRGHNRLTIPWHEVQRFEVRRYYYRIVAADRVILVAVPGLCGNPELRGIIERNLPPTATYRHRRGWWRARFGSR